MRRLASIACAGLMLGGCWFYESEVSAFGEGDRPDASPLASGVYCALEIDEGAPALLDSECLDYAWDAGARRIVLHEPQGAEETEDDGPSAMSVMTLDGGLLLIEIENDEPTGSESRFAIAAAVAAEEGYVFLPRPAAARLVEIGQSTGVVLGDYDPESKNDFPRIIGGAPEAVQSFVARSAAAWLAEPAPDGVDKLAQDDSADDVDYLGPQYYIRLEALPAAQSGDRDAAVAASYARVRAALERAAEG